MVIVSDISFLMETQYKKSDDSQGEWLNFAIKATKKWKCVDGEADISWK